MEKNEEKSVVATTMYQKIRELERWLKMLEDYIKREQMVRNEITKGLASRMSHCDLLTKKEVTGKIILF